VDVWIVFGIYVFQLGIQGLVAGAGQAGKSLVDLYIWITDMEVGVVVISWEPAGAVLGISLAWGEKLSRWTNRLKGSV
jgi:hypothetical protein